MDSTTLLDYSRKLLFVEAYTNIFLFGPLMFMFPKLLLDPQYGENETPGVAAYEVFSWFGAMTVGGSGECLQFGLWRCAHDCQNNYSEPHIHDIKDLKECALIDSTELVDYEHTGTVNCGEAELLQ
mmetsp:Transcript_27803/g.34007  ORF Transcript_27803/g.34007 Transcript_27803/m.34007 type:complete len:126 (+) Transcript_27803:323-700(+)